MVETKTKANSTPGNKGVPQTVIIMQQLKFMRERVELLIDIAKDLEQKITKIDERLKEIEFKIS